MDEKINSRYNPVMERSEAGTIVIVEKKGIGGTTCLGTAVRTSERRAMPIVPFTNDQELHRPAPKVACAEVDGIPLWEGHQCLRFQDPDQVRTKGSPKEILLGYKCPVKDRVEYFARELGYNLYQGGLAGDGQISPEDLNRCDLRTHFPYLFQIDNKN